MDIFSTLLALYEGQQCRLVIVFFGVILKGCVSISPLKLQCLADGIYFWIHYNFVELSDIWLDSI